MWDVVEYVSGSDSTVLRNHIDYDAFGRILAQSDATIVTVAYYTGRYRDLVTGLQYNRARWYDADTGRWLSEDPIGFEAGDANLYRYVGNQITYAITTWDVGGDMTRVLEQKSIIDVVAVGSGLYYVMVTNQDEAEVAFVALDAVLSKGKNPRE